MITAVVVSKSILPAYASQNVIVDQLNAYRGQPISVAIAKFGNPTERRVIEGEQVYFWSNIPIIDGHSYSCKIRAIVDKQQIVTNWGYVGCAF